MTAPMPPAVTRAFLCMAFCIGRDMAQHWANLARQRGATDDQLTEAWAAWYEAEAASVQTVVCRRGAR